MKKNIILSSVLMLFATLVFSSCDDNEPYQSIHPSPRDGVYEGENLTVTIDGEPCTTIKSVRIFSEIIGYAQGTVIGEQKPDSNPVYHTSVIFKGFPGSNEELILKTVSTLYYFDGQFQLILDDLSSRYYEYNGTFTGDADSPHSEQGLILEFTSIENPNYSEFN